MWKTLKLIDIVNIDIGKTPSRNNSQFWDKDKKGSNVWVSIRDMSKINGLYIDDSSEYISNEGAKLFKEIPKNTLIMSFKLSIGKLAITKINLRTNEAIAAFKIKDKSLVSNKYLYYFLLSINWDRLAGDDIKVKGKTLNKAKLKKILITLPPLKEQQNIVANLDALFAEINKAINIEKNKILLTEKVNNVLFTTLIRKEKNLKTIKFGDICTIKGRIGYRGYTKKDITTKGKGAISLSPSNIIKNKLDFKKTTYISWEKYEQSPEIMIYPEDIIFCKTGSTYGKTALIKSLPEKATLNPQLVVLKEVKCINKYLFYYMLSDNFKNQIENIVGGAALPTLTQKSLSETNVLLPPNKVQETIVHKIENNIKNIETIWNNSLLKINNYKTLKSTILKKKLNIKSA